MAKKNQAQILRRILDRALEKDRHKEAIEALESLERLEPREPRWPQRRGDVLKRIGRSSEAEDAYLRAVGLFSQQGFLPHAVAIAKVVVALNPARADVLDRINQQATRDLRRTLSGVTKSSLGMAGAEAAPRAPVGAAGRASRAPVEAAAAAPAHPSPREVADGAPEVRHAVAPSRAPLPRAQRPTGSVRRLEPARAPMDRPEAGESIEIDLSDMDLEPMPTAPAPVALSRAPAAMPPGRADEAPIVARGGRPVSKHESFIGGIPSRGLAGAARPLAPAQDLDRDEVRFADVPEEEWVEIDAADLEVMLPAGVEAELELEPPVEDSWTTERLAMFSGSTLFAEVPPDALAMLAHAAELVELRPGDYVCRHGEPADALYVIVEGMAYVVLPWLQGGGVDLAPGQVFGEGALLQGGSRQADVRARGALVMLRISREDLQRVIERHAEVHQLLFDLLVHRLVANTLQTSPLFSAFDQVQRRELARMFEVRRAPGGVALLEQGKRSDGLYILLAGEFHELLQGEWVRLPPGAMVGHRSLISHDPSRRTIYAASESVVLRMPSRRFGTFAAQFPPAVAHLAELAARSPEA